VIIERRTDEEPSVFELCLGNTNPRSVDFKVAYPWMDKADRWENVNAWGALLGIDSLSSLFSDTPPELYEVDEEGCCTSLLPGDISIQTQAAADPQAAQEDLSPQLSSSAHWIPRSIQISAPLYSEQTEVLDRLSPDVSAIIVQSGLLPTIDAFAGENADLQKRLLDRASSRSSSEFTLELSRLVHLGPSEVERSDDDVDPDEACAGKDGPETFGSNGDTSETHSLDADEPPFSAHPLEFRVSSRARIKLLSDDLGVIHLEHYSTGQPRGGVLIRHSELYNFAVPAISATAFMSFVAYAVITVQITIFGTSYIDLKQIARAVRLSVDGYTGTYGNVTIQRTNLTSEADGAEMPADDQMLPFHYVQQSFDFRVAEVV
jgi:hypothetical protein